MFKMSFHIIYCKAKQYLCLLWKYLKKEKCSGCGEIREVNKFGFCQNCFKEINFYFNKDSSFYHIAIFDGPIKKSIHEFKYQRKKYIGKKLALFIYEHVKEKLPEFDIIVPVPLHWKKEFLRGFNQSAVIAVYLSKLFKKPVIIDAVIKVRNTQDQIGLNIQERKKNVVDAFRVKNVKMIEGKKILLVDDVFTSGATSQEIRKILKNAGAKKVIILTVAKTIT